MSSVCLINTEALKAEALRLGFFAVGFSPAGLVDEAVQHRYRQWLRAGNQGDMHYLENHLDKRFNPTLLVPDARTVISLAISYHPASHPVQPALAWYAQGEDYHDVVKDLMRQLMQQFGLQGRCFTDSAPVLDRYWAWRSGLGFIGRHTQLVIPRWGSAFFLGEIIVEQEADRYDSPITDSYFTNLCGTCHRCVDACPMGALETDGAMQACRCLSYLSIEQRGPIPEEAKPHLCECFYGCYRCTQACPHLHAPSDVLPNFQGTPELLSMTPHDWAAMDEEKFRNLFRHSAVRRAKYEGLKRNIECISREN